MTNKPMLSVERNKFEAFWRATMNVEVMDLHRCEFPMTAYDDQPYACHETDRSWMTWKGRALLDKEFDGNSHAPKQQGEPVAWIYKQRAQSEFAAPRISIDFTSKVLDALRIGEKSGDGTLMLSSHPGYFDWQPLYAEQPAPVAVVMPEPYGLAMFKMLSGFDSVTPEQFNLVWTACRKEVARLNGVKP